MFQSFWEHNAAFLLKSFWKYSWKSDLGDKFLLNMSKIDTIKIKIPKSHTSSGHNNIFHSEMGPFAYVGVGFCQSASFGGIRAMYKTNTGWRGCMKNCLTLIANCTGYAYSSTTNHNQPRYKPLSVNSTIWDRTLIVIRVHRFRKPPFFQSFQPLFLHLTIFSNAGFGGVGSGAGEKWLPVRLEKRG